MDRRTKRGRRLYRRREKWQVGVTAATASQRIRTRDVTANQPALPVQKAPDDAATVVVDIRRPHWTYPSHMRHPDASSRLRTLNMRILSSRKRFRFI